MGLRGVYVLGNLLNQFNIYHDIMVKFVIFATQICNLTETWKE